MDFLAALFITPLIAWADTVATTGTATVQAIGRFAADNPTTTFAPVVVAGLALAALTRFEDRKRSRS